MIKHKDNFLVLTILAAAFFVTVFLVTERTNFLQKAATPDTTIKVENTGDLDKASESLDQTNLDTLDSPLQP